MIYAINYFFCMISAFFFKNFLTIILFVVLGFIILKYLIQKLSNITIILYLLFIITLFSGGLVLWLLPDKEDILSDKVVDSYYLGTLSFILLIALLISIGYDLYTLINHNKNKKRKIEKENIINIEKPIKATKKKNVTKKTIKKKETKNKEKKSVKKSKE